MKKTLIFLALAATCLAAQAQNLGQFEWKLVPPAEAGMTQADLDALRANVQSQIDAHTIAGAVTAIVKDGNLVWYEAQGESDPTTGKKMEKDAIFTLMSSSKIMAGIAALQLVEQGKMGLEDPVSKYIPELADMKVYVKEGEIIPADKPITVKHLLTHTAGLMTATNLGFLRNQIPSEEGDRLQDAVPRFAQATLDFQPGTQWSYSPLHGIDVAARIIEIVSGEPYQQYVQKHIFEPLGMTETWFTVPESERERVVPLVKYENGNWVKQPKMFGDYGEAQTSYFSASGGLLSTAKDYTILEVALVNGGILNGKRILSEESVKLMGSNLVGDLYAKFMPVITDGYGFGITVRVAEDESKCHGVGKGAFNWNGAYGTDSWADPANGIAAAYFIAHSDGPREPVNAFQETFYKSMGQQASGIPSDVRMTTLEFKENSNGEKLQMDFYRAAGDTRKRPTIIFSFGGGWAGGDRLIYREVAPRYVRHGINVAAIDYTLTLKGQKNLPDSTLFGPQYSNAIMTSVADLYDATRYLLDHQDELGVREDKIILQGGSAGATNSVMAEYWLCNEASLATARLPKGFNYAGVIPAAGSVWKTGLEDPEWKSMPCPHMFMHGTADWVVPFWDTPIPASDFKAFSPKTVAELLRKRGACVETFFVEEADHMMAAAPIFDFPYGGYTVDQTEHMLDFIDRVVLKGEKVQIDYYEKDYDTPRNFMVVLGMLAAQENTPDLNNLNNEDLQEGQHMAEPARKSQAYTLPQVGTGAIVTKVVKGYTISRDSSFQGSQAVYIHNGAKEPFLDELVEKGYITVLVNTSASGLKAVATYMAKNAAKWNADASRIAVGGKQALAAAAGAKNIAGVISSAESLNNLSKIAVPVLYFADSNADLSAFESRKENQQVYMLYTAKGAKPAADEASRICEAFLDRCVRNGEVFAVRIDER